MSHKAQINGSIVPLEGTSFNSVKENACFFRAMYSEMFKVYTPIELAGFTYEERKIALEPAYNNFCKAFSVQMTYSDFNFGFRMVAGAGSQDLHADTKDFLQEMSFFTEKEIKFVKQLEFNRKK